MDDSFRYRHFIEGLVREIRISPQYLLLLGVCIVGAVSSHQVVAQSKPTGAAKSPLCTRDIALDMIKQQVDFSKTFNNPKSRIAVLIKAADLFWPYQQKKAREVFTEAFELATQNEKENEAKAPRSLILRMQVPDQRHVVIRAVAKRDVGWAKHLIQEMHKQSGDDGQGSSSRDSFNDTLAAGRLLQSAHQLMSTDVNAAVDLARASLNYPAGFGLTRFLYRLAEVDQQEADQIYAQALAIYADRPMREFLYLQAYPFAWPNTLNTPIFSFHEVPASFVTNQSLQRQFVQVLLRRAQQTLEEPIDQSDTYLNPNATLTPGPVSLLQGLVRLEPQVRESLPDLLAPLTQAREKILVSLSVETQKLLLQPGQEISTKPGQTFDERVELAQKVSDVNERDSLFANAVLSSSGKESLGDVIQAIEKISDSNLRAQFLEWLYFHRATAAVQDKQFEEAEKLTSKVEGLEQRAFLHTEIAKGLLKSRDTQTHGREVLDEAINEAKKAGMTIFAARTLLTASNLYIKIDLGRSISVLSDALNCINRIEAPDFISDDQALENKPRRRVRGGQYGGTYMLRFYMPGLDPESAFREMAKIDFDTALPQSSVLTDKFQRSLSTLGLAEVCLHHEQTQPKEKPPKSVRP